MIKINIFFTIIWLTAAISILGNLYPYMTELSWGKRFFIGGIVLLGAPFMIITQGIETILDFFIEGWNDSDKFGC